MGKHGHGKQRFSERINNNTCTTIFNISTDKSVFLFEDGNHTVQDSL